MIRMSKRNRVRTFALGFLAFWSMMERRTIMREAEASE